jgi:ATP-dependent Clp protease ATP-binding subunit ClpC
VKAQEEARLLHHDFIGTEHLVLGLVAIGEGVAFEALNSLGVTVERARDEVSKTVERGVEAPRAHIPFTPRGKKVLELALREALALGHNYIGTEHVLLAVLREKEGVGCQVLEALGLNLKHTRTLVLGLLSGGPAPSQKVTAAPDADVRVVLDELRSKIEELERRLSD